MQTLDVTALNQTFVNPTMKYRTADRMQKFAPLFRENRTVVNLFTYCERRCTFLKLEKLQLQGNVVQLRK